MPFLLLLFLTLACLPEEWSPLWLAGSPAETALLSALLTWLGAAAVIGFARIIALSTAHRLILDSQRRDRVLQRYGRLRTYHIFILLGMFAAQLYLLDWGWAVQYLCGSGHAMIPGAELLILSPVLVGLVLSWAAFYDAERAVHVVADPDGAEPFWSRGAYVAFHVRQNGAWIAGPLLVLILMKSVHRVVPDTPAAETFTSICGIVLAMSIFIGLPWLLRLALGLKPLPPGELRDRLEVTARRLHFRCSNILVWHTRGNVANAMVAGVFPWVRYVLLSDRLISDLTPDEVEAVFGHEIGHVKHHHMLYYLGFLIGSLFLMVGLWTLLATYLPFLDHAPNLQALPLVTMLGAYVFVVFGFLSRRCERQADLYGCRAVSCGRAYCFGHDATTALGPENQDLRPTRLRRIGQAMIRPLQPLAGTYLCPTGIRTFIEALEKVARLNGIPREKPGWLSSWQHSTIARRVDFLQQVLRDPRVERHFQWRVALVKWALLLALLWVLALLILGIPGTGHEHEGAPPAATAGRLDELTPGTGAHTAPWE
jgi:STE24 endopeptidase